MWTEKWEAKRSMYTDQEYIGEDTYQVWLIAVLFYKLIISYEGINQINEYD